MAGNLIKIEPKYTRNGIPLNKIAVENLLNTVTQLEDSYGSYNKDLFQDRISELRNLQQAVLASERLFYMSLNLDYNDPRKSLIDLTKRIDEINNSSGLINLVNAEKYNMVSELSNYLLRITSNQLLREVVSPEFKEMLIKETKVEALNDIKDYLNAMNQVLQSKDIQASGFRVGSDTKFSATLTLDNNNNLQIATTGRVHFDGSTKSKLKTLIAQYKPEMVTVQNTISTKRDKQDLLYNTISKRLHGDAKAYLYYEIYSNFDYYDVFLGDASLKGFFGEIHSNILLNMLFASYTGYKKAGLSVPTGNLKSAAKGQDINIDTVVKGFGFQIKNYTLQKDESITFNGSNNAGHFIQNRASIVKEKDILMALFASYQFNQQIPNRDENYTDILTSFNNVIKNTENIFSLYTDNIIHLASQFKAKKNGNLLFETEGTYFNTFFLINGKLIPSSFILEAVIKSMEMSKDNRLITFTLKKWQNVLNKNNINTVNEKRYDELEQYKLANMVKLDYSTNLDLNKILNIAYSFIDKF